MTGTCSECGHALDRHDALYTTTCDVQVPTTPRSWSTRECGCTWSRFPRTTDGAQ